MWHKPTTTKNKEKKKINNFFENKRKTPKPFQFFLLENGEAFSNLGVILGFASTSLHDSLTSGYQVMGLDPWLLDFFS
jgi:hypothetical protein